MITPYLLSQIFGGIALVIGVQAYLHRQDKRLKLFIGAAAICMAIHFALLNAWLGAVLSLVGAVRFITAGYTHNTWVMAGFMAFGVAYGAATHQTLPDVLPVLANIIASYALFNLSGVPLRVGLMLVSFCWVAYNGLHYSVTGIALESFYILSNALNLWRHSRKQPLSGV